MEHRDPIVRRRKECVGWGIEEMEDPEEKHLWGSNIYRGGLALVQSEGPPQTATVGENSA